MIQDLPKGLLEASRTVLQDSKDYEEFFKKALKKFGVDSPADFKSDEEKKKFFCRGYNHFDLSKDTTIRNVAVQYLKQDINMEFNSLSIMDIFLLM